MNVILNDKSYTVNEGITLEIFIEQIGQKPQGIAVAIDGEVIPKTEWNSFILTENVKLMLIHAVSGG